jgi:hypothetical protein
MVKVFDKFADFAFFWYFEARVCNPRAQREPSIAEFVYALKMNRFPKTSTTPVEITELTKSAHKSRRLSSANSHEEIRYPRRDPRFHKAGPQFDHDNKGKNG